MRLTYSPRIEESHYPFLALTLPELPARFVLREIIIVLHLALTIAPQRRCSYPVSGPTNGSHVPIYVNRSWNHFITLKCAQQSKDLNTFAGSSEWG